MVIVKVQGGLGNQLFQCAFARELASRGVEVYLDDAVYYERSRAARRQHHGFDLKLHMELGAPMATAKQWKQLRVSPHHVLHAVRMLMPFGYRRRVVVEDQNRYSPEYVTSENVYCVGYWQNEKYFLNVRDEMRRAMHAVSMDDESAARRESIRSCNAVSVHVRRGDYLKVKLFAGLCDLSYYQRAIHHIREHVADPVFHVFSDDLAWCRANLALPDAVFVDGNLALKSMYDVLLMGACKHNIIANSTFSWWGAWMNPHPNKIVIAPARWYNIQEREDSLELPAGWLRT